MRSMQALRPDWHSAKARGNRHPRPIFRAPHSAFENFIIAIILLNDFCAFNTTYCGDKRPCVIVKVR